MMKQLIVFSLLCFSLFSCTSVVKHDKSFIKVENGQFIKNGKPYYYVGANFGYGAILGSEGEGGNRKRLLEELDSLKSIGVDNLRVLVGSDGVPGATKVEPTLQVSPGAYNDTILAGLDYLLAEMGKRDMSVVLYLNNSWEWSGGYGQYLEWAGFGKAPVPAVDGWNAFTDFVKQYPKSDKAKSLFANYVKDIVTRTNRYTGIKYTDDPTIMSWQIGNEPRAFAEENKEVFAEWIAQTASLIKSLDANHLVSTGSEGKAGMEGDIALYERVHKDANIDYLTIHIWPYNWGWATKDSLEEKVEFAKINTGKYIDEHLSIAKKYNKPMVLEEFGYPRDGFEFTKSSSVEARNSYYQYVFDLIGKNFKEKGLFSGCNFWAWGGIAELSSDHHFWQKGDDYTGDPAQEQQGLNSVFSSDASTLQVIKDAVLNLTK